jgi:glucan 1,3-beta-glucosidase
MSEKFHIMALTVKTACNTGGGPENCQINMIDLEGTLTNVNIYCLSTVGTVNVISEAGNSLAVYSDNVNVYPDNIALFQLAAGSGGSGTYTLEFFDI